MPVLPSVVRSCAAWLSVVVTARSTGKTLSRTGSGVSGGHELHELRVKIVGTNTDTLCMQHHLHVCFPVDHTSRQGQKSSRGLHVT